MQLCSPVLCLKCRRVDDGTVWQWNNFFLEVANCNKLIFTEKKDQKLKLNCFITSETLRNYLKKIKDYFYLYFSEIFLSLILGRLRLCIVKPLKMSSAFVSVPQNFSQEKYIYTSILFPISRVLDPDVEVRSLSDIKYVMSIISQMDQRQFITDCK